MFQKTLQLLLQIRWLFGGNSVLRLELSMKAVWRNHPPFKRSYSDECNDTL